MFTHASKNLSTLTRTMKALLIIRSLIECRQCNGKRKIKKQREDAAQKGNKESFMRPVMQNMTLVKSGTPVHFWLLKVDPGHFWLPKVDPGEQFSEQPMITNKSFNNYSDVLQ